MSRSQGIAKEQMYDVGSQHDLRVSMHHQPAPHDDVETARSQSAMALASSAAPPVVRETACVQATRLQQACLEPNKTRGKSALGDITSKYHKMGNRPPPKGVALGCKAGTLASSNIGKNRGGTHEDRSDEDAVIQRHINVWQGLSALEGMWYYVVSAMVKCRSF